MLEYSLEEVTPASDLLWRRSQLAVWEEFARCFSGRSGFGWDTSDKSLDRFMLIYGPTADPDNQEYILAYYLKRREICFRDAQYGNYEIYVPCREPGDVRLRDSRVVVGLDLEQGEGEMVFGHDGVEMVNVAVGKKSTWELNFRNLGNNSKLMSLDLKMENSKRTRTKLEDVTGFIASNNNWLGYSLSEDRIQWLGVSAENQVVKCEEELPYKGTGLVAATFKFLNSL